MAKLQPFNKKKRRRLVAKDDHQRGAEEKNTAGRTGETTFKRRRWKWIGHTLRSQSQTPRDMHSTGSPKVVPPEEGPKPRAKEPPETNFRNSTPGKKPRGKAKTVSSGGRQ